VWKDYNTKSLQIEMLKFATQNPDTDPIIKTSDNATIIAVGFDFSL
jgi:hypothetical protein